MMQYYCHFRSAKLLKKLSFFRCERQLCKLAFVERRRNFLNTSWAKTQFFYHSWWTSRASLLSSAKTDRGNLHNALPYLESTRGNKLKKTQERLQETKRIVSEKIENMENIWTIPNGLCFLRIGLTPVLGYMVVTEAYPAALGIFVLAGLTDLLDGYIACNFSNQQSVFGSLLDPAADKFLVATLFLTLTIQGFIPVPLTSLIILRDVCLVGAVFYLRYQSLPPPRTMLRYFDATLPTARMSPTFISKVNTSVQLALVAFTLAAPVFSYVDHPYLHFLWYLTASTTVISGMSYLVSKGTYTILTKSKSRKSS